MKLLPERSFQFSVPLTSYNLQVANYVALLFARVGTKGTTGAVYPAFYEERKWPERMSNDIEQLVSCVSVCCLSAYLGVIQSWCMLSVQPGSQFVAQQPVQ